MHWRYVVALCLCDYFLEIDGVTKKSHTDCRKCTHGHGNVTVTQVDDSIFRAYKRK